MSWHYFQTTGKMLRPDGTLAAVGYSGKGAGKNNPAMQEVHNAGPIPQGSYTMEVIRGEDGEPCDYEGKKKPVIRLHPSPKNNMFGRSGFLVHGDTNPPGNASEGCPIQPHFVRVEMMQTIDAGDAETEVFK